MSNAECTRGNGQAKNGQNKMPFIKLYRKFAFVIIKLAIYNPLAFRLLLVFVRRMDSRNTVRISNAFLQKLLDCSKSSICRAVATLESQEFILVSKYGTCNVYHINPMYVWTADDAKKKNSGYETEKQKQKQLGICRETENLPSKDNSVEDGFVQLNRNYIDYINLLTSINKLSAAFLIYICIHMDRDNSFKVTPAEQDWIIGNYSPRTVRRMTFMLRRNGYLSVRRVDGNIIYDVNFHMARTIAASEEKTAKFHFVLEKDAIMPTNQKLDDCYYIQETVTNFSVHEEKQINRK